jgi:hypothetical protein
LDYGFPNQTAEIYIGPAGKKPEDIREEEWEKVGIWYLAGSNTCLYSDPGGELEKRLHRTKTSNRRFRDDEFLIPARYTKGKSELRLRVRYIPDEQELFPGFPFPRESAWSELRYEVYSYVLPGFTVKK